MNTQAIKVAAILAALIVFFSGVLGFLYVWEKNMTAIPAADTAAQDEELVYYQGAWYRPKEDLESVLAIGVDQAAVDETLRRDKNYEQSDFLLLLVLDQKSRSCSAIHINRDTMTEIQVLDDSTNVLLGTVTGQLSLAHSYGNCPEACCRNTVAAVSNLLYGIQIDHYFSLTMDGVMLLNDLAGGVTVEIMDDLTAIDSALVQGESVTLAGRQALAYVQARMGLENPSNLRRMERQRQYLEALQAQLTSRMEADGEFAMSALLELNAYLVSDCSIEKMSALADLLEAYGAPDYYTLAGKTVVGEEYIEYYIDQTAARHMVMELFYEQVEKAG